MKIDRAKITKDLSELTEKHIEFHDCRSYCAKEVTFDYGSRKQFRVDYMKFKPVNNTVSGIEKGEFYCYEIKSCVEDFRSKNGHNFIGERNYYVMPYELYLKVYDEIPAHVGIYYPDEYGNCLICGKSAKRVDRQKALCEMLLMMFRSNARDTRCKGADNE